MNKIFNKPLEVIETYSSNNQKFISWITKNFSNNIDFKPFFSNKKPWTIFDLILKESVQKEDYYFVFKVISNNISNREIIDIRDSREKILDRHSSFFKNFDNFIFIFVSDIDFFPSDLKIGKFKNSIWQKIFSVNLYINTITGEFSRAKVPIRFRAGLEYLEEKILLPFKTEFPPTSSDYQFKQDKDDFILEETSITLEEDKEQLLIRLKGIMKTHSVVSFDFVSRKLNIDKKEIENLIYDASGLDLINIRILDEETIALKKSIPDEFIAKSLNKRNIDSNETQYSSEICIICKNKIEDDDEIAVCPHCANVAHESEFLEWLKIKQKCPLCKKKLKVNELMIKARKK